MKQILYLLLLLCFPCSFMAQVGIGTTTPNSSSILDLSSETKGVLIPRMSSAQRQMIPLPAQGLLVFDTTTNSFWYRNPTTWVELQDSINTEVHRIPANKLYVALTDSLGIGTITPANKVEIVSGGIQSGLFHPKGRALYVTANSLSDAQGVEFRHNNGTQGIGFGFNTIYATGSNSSQDLTIKAKGIGGNLYFKTNGISRVFVDSAGFVGIGTNTPGATMDVVRGTALLGTARFKGSTFDSHFNYLTNESTFIRGGKAGSHVILNDQAGLGNVGIGTGTPSQKLHVEGKAFVRDSIGIGISTPHAQLHLSNSTGNKKIVMWESANNGHQFFGFGVESSGMMRYQVPLNVNDHVFYSGASATTSNELMRIAGSGNVGIGLDPVNKLDVQAGTTRTGLFHPINIPLYVTGNLNEGSNGIEFRHHNGTQGIGFGYNTIYATGSDDNQHLGMAARGPAGVLIFKTNGTERMRVSGTGNVMIGTPTAAAGHKLSVAGKIAAEEILVDLQGDWPDYVFEENYPLQTLDQLKNFIEEHNHLPGVPSAKEVDKHGIYLGKISTILLKKIEELTLYILQQEARIQRLEKSTNAK